jgi:putative ABC transport system permease protein
MNDLFGLSMTYVMIALLVILGIAASTILWVVVRHRVMFLIGIRNIPRRRAQTILIIIGLMLSTLIISTAFSIGDTVDYSLTNLVYDRLHSIDEVVHTRTDQKDTAGDSSLATTKPIPGYTAQSLITYFKTIPGVDGAVPVIRTTVPVLDTRTRLNEPQSGIIGADPAEMRGFESDLQALDGSNAPLSALAPNEIYVDQALADKLDAVKGDTLQIFVSSQPHDFVVKDIVKNRVLGGTLLEDDRGLAMTLAQAQTLLGRPDTADLILISNTGGVRDSLGNSTAVKDALNARLEGTDWSADATKADLVDQASQAASFLTTFFVVLGLFSIAAGALLIFLIFVMLAAERKVEMGMIRAVGTKRQHLVQMFMSEGMAYNVGAAAVGCALGVVVSIGMVRVMASLFGGGEGTSLNIAFHVTPRSLIVSYSLGVVLTFLTVTFSSWRIGNLNIVSAIRDTADPTVHAERPVARPGILGALAFVRWIFFKARGWRGWLVGLGLLLLAVPLVIFTVIGFTIANAIYGSSSVASVVSVLLGVGAICSAVLAFVSAGLALNRIFQTGAMALIVGAALVVVGLITWQGSAYAAGISLLFIGAALTLVMLRVPARPVFTTMGLTLLVYWLLGAGGHIPPNMNGGIEMFFLSGIIMVLSATFVLIYNADIMLGLLTRIGNLNARFVPSIRTAVAYPLANKFRTGMTIAMISLVMFALVMMSTMNSNFSRIFLSNEALGGYDVVVRENQNNPVPDLKAALQHAGSDPSAITADDTIGVANPILSEARMAPAATPESATGASPTATPSGEDFSRYTIIKPSPGFLRDNGVKFHARADGYSTDAEIWQALATQPDVAVIDAFAVGGGGFGGGGFTLTGIDATDTTFAPIKIQIRDAANPSNVHDVSIIGIFTTKASAVYQGLYLSPAAFSDVFPKAEYSAHFVKLAPGTDSQREAKYIESTLSADGVQGDSLRKLIDDAQAQNRSFFYLIQGFMGIGLFVGIAAVGVIAFRTVVERRQQIGMMRALGYTRRAVAWSFIMESSFIALLGILSGISLGILLAYQLLQGDSFAGGAIDSFYVPWTEIAIFGGFAFVASFLMTIIPSRQASSIPIAEALRYE